MIKIIHLCAFKLTIDLIWLKSPCIWYTFRDKSRLDDYGLPFWIKMGSGWTKILEKKVIFSKHPSLVQLIISTTSSRGNNVLNKLYRSRTYFLVQRLRYYCKLAYMIIVIYRYTHTLDVSMNINYHRRFKILYSRNQAHMWATQVNELNTSINK